MDTHLNIVPTLMANKEEANSEMVVDKCNSAHVKKKKSLTNIESLPDELVFNILVHLPAEDIYNCAMLVCWKWYRMIRTRNFVDSHLQHSTPGLLVQNFSFPNSPSPSFFVAMRKGRIEVSNFSHELVVGSWASCNGLILEYDSLKGSIKITNPAIKQLFAIPQIFHRLQRPHWPSVAYSAASKEYKAVHSYERYDVGSRVTRWAIFTVGVDESWRHVCTQHLPKNIIVNNSYTVEGFIHWRAGGTHVLTLNVETEVMTWNPVPRGYENRSKHFLSTGKSLSMFVRCSEFSLEVWDMKSENGEWSKMYNIDLVAHKCKFEELRRKENCRGFVLTPVGWLKYQEVLVFCFPHPTRVFIAYNVVTQEVDFFYLGFKCEFRRYGIHTNSLVWLAGSRV